MVTKSSTEAEIVALSDGVSVVLWGREWILAQGYDLGPTVVYQDNKGVLNLMRNGRNNKERTKHLNIRYFFVQDRVKNGELVLEYINTKDMLADLMTKPVNGALLKHLRSKMMEGNNV